MKKQFMKGLAASLILALSVTSVAPAVAAEEAALKAVESTAKATNMDAVYRQYKNKIEYYKSLRDWNMLDDNQNISPWLKNEYGHELHYALVDLANDGIPELLIATVSKRNAQYYPHTNYCIYDVIGVQNGIAKDCIQGMQLGGTRNWYIMNNNVVLDITAGGSSWREIRAYNKMNKNSISLSMFSYLYTIYPNGVETIYKGTNNYDIYYPINKAEFERTRAQYTFKQDIQWYPLDNLEPLKKALLPLPPVKIMLNGQELQCDQPPIIQNGRTLVPFRAILEGMNAEVGWDGNTRTVTASLDGIDLSLKIGSKTMYKNGRPIALDVPAQIINNRTLIPARAVSEALGAKVDWDGNTRTVYVVQNDNKEPVIDENEKSYREANQSLQDGYPYEAYYKFEKIKNYKDSSKKMKDAESINHIAYSSNEPLYLLNNRENYKQLTEHEIINLILDPLWISPCVQNIGYNYYNFDLFGKGDITGNGYTNNMYWTVFNKGLFWSYDESNIIPPLTNCKYEFREIADGVYGQFSIKNDGSNQFVSVFINTKSPYAELYQTCEQHIIDASKKGEYYITRKDENKLGYQAVIGQQGNIVKIVRS